MTTVQVRNVSAHPESQQGDLTQGGTTARTVLLASGILAALLYVAMLFYVPTQWEEYSSAAQTVSELSAIGAPTRSLWAGLGTVYTLLVIAFGCGVWLSAGRDVRLRVVGGSMIASGVIGAFWPPMHLRGTEPTLTDTLHIVFAIVWLGLTLLTLSFGAAALGKRFRLYSIATLAIFVLFGTLTGMEGPRVAADLPTPWIGVWERINIGAFLLWTVVLTIALLRARGRPQAAVRASSTMGSSFLKERKP